MAKLFLDDLRQAPDTTWSVVRTTDEAIRWVQTNGCPECISFDFYLANGLDSLPFVHWLIEQDKEKNGAFLPKNFSFEVHSNSPAGRAKLRYLLETYLASKRPIA